MRFVTPVLTKIDYVYLAGFHGSLFVLDYSKVGRK